LPRGNFIIAIITAIADCILHTQKVRSLLMENHYNMARNKIEYYNAEIATLSDVFLSSRALIYDISISANSRN
jgi:hypothetical protein